MRHNKTIECTQCKTIYEVREEGTRFPWIDKEEYSCPVCGETGGPMRTHYTLEETVSSLENTIEPYKSNYLKPKNNQRH